MSRSEGFTLIELMIAVLIIGIIASIAIPSYMQYVVDARQSEAQQAMMDIASRAEQYRLDARDYPSGLSTNGGELTYTPPTGVTANYSLSLSAGTSPPTYTITASPRSGTQVEGTSTLTLDNAGNKTPADEW